MHIAVGAVEDIAVMLPPRVFILDPDRLLRRQRVDNLVDLLRRKDIFHLFRQIVVVRRHIDDRVRIENRMQDKVLLLFFSKTLLFDRFYPAHAVCAVHASYPAVTRILRRVYPVSPEQLEQKTVKILRAGPDDYLPGVHTHPVAPLQI